MKINQELLDHGFIVRVRTNNEMLNVLDYFDINPSKYVFGTYGDRTCLDCLKGDVLYANKSWYEDNHPYGNNIYDYKDIWVSESTDNKQITNTKEKIVSLILDKQLSSGKRFDKFINDLPCDNEMLISFIFGDEYGDWDLLLQEVFDILGYLNCEINIEEVE
jgi:hypothetical protein